MINDHKLRLRIKSPAITAYNILDYQQTPHWFTVKFSGQLVVQVKLFRTKPESQAVQLSTVDPKQKVQ